MKNNKGLTLVELIVAAAIFALVSLGVATFMVTGTRFGNLVNRNVQLQYDSQLAMTMIGEYIVDCKKGIFVTKNNETNDTCLYLVNNEANPDQEEGDPAEVNMVHVFWYNSGRNTVYYGKTPNGATIDLSNPLAVAADILAENVADLQFTLQPSEDGSVHQIEVSMTMERQGKSFQATQVTALRNHPLTGENWAGLWDSISKTGV